MTDQLLKGSLNSPQDDLMLDGSSVEKKESLDRLWVSFSMSFFHP